MRWLLYSWWFLNPSMCIQLLSVVIYQILVEFSCETKELAREVLSVIVLEKLVSSCLHLR